MMFTISLLDLKWSSLCMMNHNLTTTINVLSYNAFYAEKLLLWSEPRHLNSTMVLDKSSSPASKWSYLWVIASWSSRPSYHAICTCTRSESKNTNQWHNFMPEFDCFLRICMIRLIWKKPKHTKGFLHTNDAKRFATRSPIAWTYMSQPCSPEGDKHSWGASKGPWCPMQAPILAPW